MPELPSVERARRLLESFCVGKKLIGVLSGLDSAIAAQDVKRLFQDDRSSDVLERFVCTGRTVQRVGRHGKYLWFEFDKPPHIFVHFRMTGFFVIRGHTDNYVYETLRRRDAVSSAPAPLEATVWPPKHARLIFNFSGSFPNRAEKTVGSESDLEVALVDPRRFATMHLGDSPCPLDDIRSRVVGFDPLNCMPPLESFAQKLVPFAKMRIKTVLLDQSFAAGLGNWMADEVLYHARIHPESRVADLTSRDIEALHSSVEYVVQTSCNANAEPTKFPSHWLFHIRWRGSQKRKTSRNGCQAVVTADGKKAQFSRLANRTTVFVPALQKKRNSSLTYSKVAAGRS
jgi:formamidopyrimidine-DNA glycosylase